MGGMCVGGEIVDGAGISIVVREKRSAGNAQERVGAQDTARGVRILGLGEGNGFRHELRGG